MSCEFREQLLEYISETVGDVWQLESRPDLEKDCVDYVVNEFDDDGYSRDDDFIKYLVIQFLSNLCRDAVSSQDLEYMAQQQRGNDIWNMRCITTIMVQTYNILLKILVKYIIASGITLRMEKSNCGTKLDESF